MASSRVFSLALLLDREIKRRLAVISAAVTVLRAEGQAPHEGDKLTMVQSATVADQGATAHLLKVYCIDVG